MAKRAAPRRASGGSSEPSVRCFGGACELPFLRTPSEPAPELSPPLGARRILLSTYRPASLS